LHNRAAARWLPALVLLLVGLLLLAAIALAASHFVLFAILPLPLLLLLLPGPPLQHSLAQRLHLFVVAVQDYEIVIGVGLIAHQAAVALHLFDGSLREDAATGAEVVELVLSVHLQ